MKPGNWIVLIVSIICFMGCAELANVGTTIGQQTGKLSQEDAQALQRLATQAEKAARPMTDQEEFFLGRAVAATILSQYKLYANDRLTRYVNEVGQVVALSSDRPLTYGGYHFAILDSDEVNALSCPGGIIFITRGMVKKAQNEDELAAILAHEVAHVNHKDGASAIQKSRWIEVVTTLGTEATRKLSGADVTKLLSLFEGSVNDVVKTLLVNGFSRAQEAAADQAALTFLHRAGYDPRGLTEYLAIMAKTQAAPGKPGILTTHPGTSERLSAAQSEITHKKWPAGKHSSRDLRFRQNVSA